MIYNFGPDRQPGQRVFQPSGRIQAIEPGCPSRVWIPAARRPARSEPANNQFLRLCKALHNRNNWRFSDTVQGTKASANLYSLIETAKLNGLEPYRYRPHVFKELPEAQSLTDIEQLLP